jgi:hypothetical protein
MSGNTCLVLSSAALAALLVVAARLGARTEPSAGIAFPQWDFSTSWASNLTVLGAILGTVLSANILPAGTVVISPEGYTALSLLFGILVVVAPFLYTALRKGEPSSEGPVFTGRNWAFLVASGVTIWAVNGEIGTVGLILYEAQHGKALALGAVVPILGALGVALILSWWYSVQTITLLLKSETATGVAAGEAAVKAVVQPGGRAERGAAAPVPWTLL